MLGKRKDGTVVLHISDDAMTVHGDFHPHQGKGVPLHSRTVYDMLEAEGVVFGIQGESIEDAVFKTNTEKQPQLQVLIAQGTAPTDEAPAYLKLKKRFYQPRSVLNPEDTKNIDYKMVSPFILVRKGEVLARRYPAENGEPGQNVRGEETPFSKLKVQKFEPGENTEEKEGIIYALCDGCYEKTKSGFQVNESLIVPGDVDYSTGHISFSGDIIIHGTIKAGFHVASGGSVFCKKTLEASDLLCKKNLVIEGGILGHNKGRVRVHGKIETRFIEHCDVESLSGISVKRGVLQAQVYTLGELLLGEKGTILSSEIFAEKDITARQIGSSGSPPSVLHCGLNFVDYRKLHHVENQVKRLEEDLDRARHLPNTDKNNLLIEKVQHALKTMQGHAAKFKGRLFSAPDAQVKVVGDIYPGTVLNICGAEYTVKERQNRCRFFYDPEQKLIIKDKLK